MSVHIKSFVKVYRIGIALLLTAISSSAIANPLVLRLTVWEGYAPEEQRQVFQRYIQEKYNVELKMEVNFMAGPEDSYSALRHDMADIVSPAHNHINDKRFKLIQSELILPLNLKNIPNYKDLNPALRHMSHLTHSGNQYGVPIAWGPYGLVYDSNKFKSPPTSWKELWNPLHHGKYTVADYDEVNIFITALALGYKPKDFNDLEKFDHAAFQNKLTELIRNAEHLWFGVDSADDLQGRSIATSWGFALPELKKRGENWKWAYPAEGVPGWIDNLVLNHTLKDKPVLKKIAEEWLNFTLSPEFQANVFVGELAAHPVNVKAMPLVSAEQKERFYLEQVDFSQKEIFLMPELDGDTRNGFNLIWQEALNSRE